MPGKRGGKRPGAGRPWGSRNGVRRPGCMRGVGAVQETVRQAPSPPPPPSRALLDEQGKPLTGLALFKARHVEERLREAHNEAQATRLIDSRLTGPRDLADASLAFAIASQAQRPMTVQAFCSRAGCFHGRAHHVQGGCRHLIIGSPDPCPCTAFQSKEEQ